MAANKSIEAIYEDGTFRPLKPVKGLSEHERVQLTIQSIPSHKTSDQEVEAMLELAFATYEGLTEK